MAKTQIRFICRNCAHEHLQWWGQCAGCGESGTLEEVTVARASMPPPRSGEGGRVEAQRLRDVNLDDFKRWPTGISELDRVLGSTPHEGVNLSGVVPGSIVLLAGDPGIGKSTLLTQAADNISQVVGPVLYVSGEEYAQHIRSRSKRLGISSPDVFVLNETDIDMLDTAIENTRPNVVVVDSIQTMRAVDSTGAPGSVAQVRACADRFLRTAKTLGCAVFLVGHVNKEGAIAGPRVLEHTVDAVLQFEGDRSQAYRILRAVKNRFGSTNEIGVFEMGGMGLTPVENPSALLLSERHGNEPGSVVTATLEGTRPLLVEVQALVAPSHLTQPRRSTTGLDYNRATMVLAVLEKRVGIRLGAQDIFLNVAGGVKVTEPGVDLAVALATAGSRADLAVNPETVVLGEVGLSGEVRAVPHAERRLQEAARLGFRSAVIPSRNARSLKENGTELPGMKITAVSTVREAVELTFGS